MRNLLCLLLATVVMAPAAMAQNSKPVTTASGLVYESLKDGTGESPKATDTVKVHYKALSSTARSSTAPTSVGSPPRSRSTA